MRLILLILATILSIFFGYTGYLRLTDQISAIDYTFASIAISVALTFIAAHFIYRVLYYRQQLKEKREQLAAAEDHIVKLTESRNYLEKKIRLFERELKQINAASLDHTLHIRGLEEYQNDQEH